MGGILSHAEVEAILSAIEPSRAIVRAAVTGLAPENADFDRHDYQRTEALRGAALKVVYALHEGICARWQVRLETLLQSHVVVRPVGACHSTPAAFFAATISSHVTCPISHAGSVAELLLLWSTELVRQLVGKMLGGSDGQAQSDDGAMTKIELRLLARLNEAVLGELASLLGDSLEIGAVWPSSETASDRITAVPAVWFSFELACCGVCGLIHLGIPEIALPLTDDAIEIKRGSIPEGIEQVSLRVSASLATLKLKAEDLAGLQVGDIVMTDLDSSETVSLNLSGRRLGRATIGTHLGHKALRMTQDGGDHQSREIC